MINDEAKMAYISVLVQYSRAVGSNFGVGRPEL